MHHHSLVLACVATIAVAQVEIPVRLSPEAAYPGQSVALLPVGTKFYRALVAFRWDGHEMTTAVLSRSEEAIVFRVPPDASPGEHQIEAEFDDNQYAQAVLRVLERNPGYDERTDGTDPNPRTQYGPPVEVGQNPRPLPPGPSGAHPPGGHYGIPPGVRCGELHVVDGQFTPDILPGRTEWDGIPPLTGRFSYLYIDYCPEEQRLYLLNDWCLGTGSYDASTCYNIFEFYTGGGREVWQVRIYHDTAKGTRVYRNGVDVTGDTTYFCGGAYGYGPSTLCPTPHTMYEFCLKVEPGGFFLPMVGDPVQPVTTSTVRCDEEGYGLIREPFQYMLDLSPNGVQWRQYPRYIPLAEVAGLVKEPNTLAGTLRDSQAVYWWAGERRSWGIPGTGSPGTPSTSRCNADARILDGTFSPGEWDGAEPARGRYSDLYAQYCNGILHVLNDWVLGTDEPDPNECYNLFEVFTANGTEHWGILVYHSKQRGIRVFLNGQDVTDDTTIVLGGAFGYGPSPRSLEPHTIYEFAIRASEGSWWLQLCDPGPTSSCRQVQSISSPPGTASAPLDNLSAQTTDSELLITYRCIPGVPYTLLLVDALGQARTLSTGVCESSARHTARISTESLALGVYFVVLRHHLGSIHRTLGSWAVPVLVLR